MIKYLGSKRLLLPVLGQLCAAQQPATALDLFTGTTRVAQEFCRQGAFTTAVDIASYSEVLAQCYVEIDRDQVDQLEIQDALEHLMNLPPKRGYVTEVFCEKARYFRPENGMRIDAIRDGIEEFYADSWLRPILLTSLMEAADAVDSTVGVQMAFLKQWAARAKRPLTLKMPALTPGTGTAIRGDALEVARRLAPVDLAYLDPPYNQHRYYTNYHIWETLVRWDAPEYYGVACKRVDARDAETKSVFNRKREMPAALAEVIGSVSAKVVALSFSNEGFVPLDDLVQMCKERGEDVRVLSYEYQRYIGAKIGIHSPDGRKVGSVSHTKNLEYIVLSGPTEEIDEMVAAVEAK